jgi:hypothetical protein
MVLMIIFGFMGEKVTGIWRTLRYSQPRNLYSPSNLIREMKWRSTRWAGRRARMELFKTVHILAGNANEKASWEK